MRFRSKSTVAVLIGIAFIAVVTLPAVGADTSNSEFVIIPEDDVFADDLYAGAIRVLVEGTIDGDLVAFAGEEVVVNGTVTGSLTAIAPRVVINGTVEGSVRASGSNVTVAGAVGRDVVAAVFSADLEESSRVAGDVVVWGWNVAALGTIGDTLSGSMRNLDLAGHVEGDVEVSVGSLTITDMLVVDGDLGYRSSSDAEGLANAEVGGAIVHETQLPPNLRVRALGLLGRFMVILFLTVAALTVAYGWPEKTGSAVAAVGSRPLKRWGVGALVFSMPLAAALLAAVVFNLAPASAAFPLLVIMLPVVLALFGIAFALALIAGIPTVGWVGGVLFKKLDLYGAMLVGGLIAGLVWYLPLIGLAVPLVVLPLGLGAWVASWDQAEAAATG